MAITNVDAENRTVTFVNPWDSTEEFTMSWEEFANLGIGYMCSSDMSNTNIADEITKAAYLGINRVQSVFDEPSYFGMFLSVHFFMLCAVADSKIKVFKNKLLEFILKKCSFYLVWICLIFSMSPMFIFIPFYTLAR